MADDCGARGVSLPAAVTSFLAKTFRIGVDATTLKRPTGERYATGEPVPVRHSGRLASDSTRTKLSAPCRLRARRGFPDSHRRRFPDITEGPSRRWEMRGTNAARPPNISGRLGCDAAVETIRSSSQSTGCRVIPAMDVEGIMSVMPTLGFPFNVWLELGGVTRVLQAQGGAATLPSAS